MESFDLGISAGLGNFVLHDADTNSDEWVQSSKLATIETDLSKFDPSHSPSSFAHRLPWPLLDITSVKIPVSFNYRISFTASSSDSTFYWIFGWNLKGWVAAARVLCTIPKEPEATRDSQESAGTEVVVRGDRGDRGFMNTLFFPPLFCSQYFFCTQTPDPWSSWEVQYCYIRGNKDNQDTTTMSDVSCEM